MVTAGRGGEGSLSNLWQVVASLSQPSLPLTSSRRRCRLCRRATLYSAAIPREYWSIWGNTSPPAGRKQSRWKRLRPRQTRSLQDTQKFYFPDSPAIMKNVDTSSRVRKSRRESKLITGMSYNITRANMAQVHNMKTAEPFSQRLSQLNPRTFLHWFTRWNEHMHRTGVFTAPTTLVSDDIREILLQNNRMTMEAFHELEPDDFIQLVANKIRCRSKLHYAEIMLDCYGRVESLSFDHVVPSNHREFLQGFFKRRTYFYKVF